MSRNLRSQDGAGIYHNSLFKNEQVMVKTMTSPKRIPEIVSAGLRRRLTEAPVSSRIDLH